jgi:hypothetical protein
MEGSKREKDSEAVMSETWLDGFLVRRADWTSEERQAFGALQERVTATVARFAAEDALRKAERQREMTTLGVQLEELARTIADSKARLAEQQAQHTTVEIRLASLKRASDHYARKQRSGLGAGR